MSKLATVHTLRGLLIVLSCALTLLAPRTASAESTYESLVQEAISRAEAGEHEMAHMLFANAHELAPNARTLRGMGVASFGAGHYARAISELSAALYHLEKPLDQRLELATRELIRRASSYVCLAHVRVTPQDATALLDGQPVSIAAEGVPMAPGEHVLKLSARGYAEQSVTLQAEANTHVDVAIDLQKLEPPAASPAPATLVAAPKKSDEQMQPARPARAPWRRNARIALTTSLSVAAASGAIAGVLWLKGNQRVDAVARECLRTEAEQCEYYEGKRKLAELKLTRWERSIDAMVVVSAVGVASALAITAWELTSRHQRQRQLTLQVQGAGLGLSGNF